MNAMLSKTFFQQNSHLVYSFADDPSNNLSNTRTTVSSEVQTLPRSLKNEADPNSFYDRLPGAIGYLTLHPFECLIELLKPLTFFGEITQFYDN